jgi:hypothetical protein
MHIANPIYDVVFKYLMEDAKVAKLLISSIIGEEIESLDFRPQEFTSDVDKSLIEGNTGTLTVYRLDFSATIKTGDGLKQVLIEIQKAKYATDIMRFRAYLGGQYSLQSTTKIETINTHTRRVGIPIIGIYFLGHTLDYTDASIIGVNRAYKDLVTGETIAVKESFIESLTHDSYIIQIPGLSKKRRNDLEKLLSIFDQSECVDATHHILNINEEGYPEKYRPLIRRLQSLILEPEVKKQMVLEDSILLDFEDMQRELMKRRQEASEAKQEANEAKQEASEAKREANEAKQEANEAKQEANEAKQEANEAKLKIVRVEREAHEANKKVARHLKSAGIALEVIRQASSLSWKEIEDL